MTKIFRKTLLVLAALLIIISFSEDVFAQRKTRASRRPARRQNWKIGRLELNAGAGLSNFLGDVGGGAYEGNPNLRDFNIEATRYSFSFGVRLRLTELIAMRAGMAYGQVYGDDKYATEPHRLYRNLSFRSNIFEVNTTLEIGIGKEQMGHRYDLSGVYGERAFQVFTYLFAGVGYFHFNPQAYYKNEWVDLRPLRTEGEGLPQYPTRKMYNQWQMCIPIGIGFRYSFDRNWGIGLEYGFRMTYTDYIDDASRTYVDRSVLVESAGGATAAALADRSVGSYKPQTAPNEQRGNPNNTDAYMFTTVFVSYKIIDKRLARGRVLWL